MADPDSRTAFLLGAGYIASIVVMFTGLVLALMAGLSGDYLAAGMCLLAVGATAGLALNAYLRR
jgi:hypothetical protein